MKKLKAEETAAMAAKFGYNLNTLRAVIDVECKGKGFIADGRPRILFERHWFAKLTGNGFTATHSDISNPKPGGYSGSAIGEHARLQRAGALNRTAALQSASWGLGQVMGFNHQSAGHPTLQGFINAMYESEARQLEAMLHFIRNNRTLDAVMREPNPQLAHFTRFAAHYNGPDYHINAYDTKMWAFYEKATALKAPIA